MPMLSQDNIARLTSIGIIWLSSVRPDGRPHLVPVWFVWHVGKIYICIEANSIKGQNILRNDQVALALEDGSSPLICEGKTRPCETPWPGDVSSHFMAKYDWDILKDQQYNMLIEVNPSRWLTW